METKIAFIFPGQGAQSVGMGASLCQFSEAARAVFAEADRVSGLPLSQVCFEGPAEKLTDTAFAQPGVVATSLAAVEGLKELLAKNGARIEPAFCAGHSVGEFAALATARAFGVEDCIRLVTARGRLMAEASGLVDGSMAAILGLEEPVLVQICQKASQETGATVQVANLNAPGQIVLSGERKALERASELARASGARRAITLDVSGPFHSIYMQPASDGFVSFVANTTISIPTIPVVLNVNAQPTRDPKAIKQEMVVQITKPVRWLDSMKTMVELGCTVFVELGPGQVLSGMAKRIAKDATVLNVEDRESLERTAEKLLQLV